MKELDFEEIDQVMEDMNNFDGITDAIAEDVAKVDAGVVKKTTSKKAKPVKKNVVKNTTKKPTPKPVAEKPVVANTKKTAPSENDTSKNDDGGEIVMVKVKKKPAPEPEEIELKPNPKTGKFMDIVSPLSDMSIQGTRPTKTEMGNTEDDDIVVGTSVAVITATTAVITDDEPVDIDDKIADRERIEDSGLDPDAEIGDLADQLEDIESEETEDPLEDFMQDSEPETEDIVDETIEGLEDDGIDELEKLADILDIPDHSDAFLENVDIEKRPLGGNYSPMEQIGAAAVADAGFGVADPIEAKADEEFIEDEGIADWFNHKKGDDKPSKVESAKKSKGSEKEQKNGVLYVLLVVLFVILGASLGVLAYFSGLF